MLVTEHEAGHNRFLLCCVGTAIIRTCEPFSSLQRKPQQPLVAGIKIAIIISVSATCRGSAGNGMIKNLLVLFCLMMGLLFWHLVSCRYSLIRTHNQSSK
ncbi:hypothetical protein CI610_03231 [invertebrate metagenome]|uniref:Uncharacterized protein n=1 Tax=invertebrate metagenome TaxID=1711999 RepID=A0A2H9T3N3_9ZZZZ